MPMDVSARPGWPEVAGRDGRSKASKTPSATSASLGFIASTPFPCTRPGHGTCSVSNASERVLERVWLQSHTAGADWVFV